MKEKSIVHYVCHATSADYVIAELAKRLAGDRRAEILADVHIVLSGMEIERQTDILTKRFAKSASCRLRPFVKLTPAQFRAHLNAVLREYTKDFRADFMARLAHDEGELVAGYLKKFVLRKTWRNAA